MKYYVEIRDISTGEVVKSIECYGVGNAHKVELGVLRQINFEKFYTMVVYKEVEEDE